MTKTKWIIMGFVAILLIAACIAPVLADAQPTLQRDKDIVLRGGDHGLGNNFAIVYAGTPSSTFDLYILDVSAKGLTPPEIQAIYSFGHTESPVYVSQGHYKFNTSNTGIATMEFVTTNLTSPYVYTFKVTDPAGKIPDAQINLEVVSEFVIPTMIPTTASTPVPTPSIGSIAVTSSPLGATIFLDNAIKGIAPLTLEGVPNGVHTVRVRLDGYYDASKFVTVTGDATTANLVLTPIPTTASVTIATTTGTITTQLTTTVTTATPKPTAKVNYSATIATMQSQIAEQSVKITEQGNILDQIVNFLRNVFGWK